MKGGGLLPLGGVEETGGYKGYGLAAMVEVLCGNLSGGPFRTHIKKWGVSDDIANLASIRTPIQLLHYVIFTIFANLHSFYIFLVLTPFTFYCVF